MVNTRRGAQARRIDRQAHAAVAQRVGRAADTDGFAAAPEGIQPVPDRCLGTHRTRRRKVASGNNDRCPRRSPSTSRAASLNERPRMRLTRSIPEPGPH